MGRPGAGGAILVIVVSVLCGCASFRPQPLEVVGFRERAATREDGQVRVTAAVPSAAESAALFGVDVATQGIQPVWLRIENHDDVDYFFLPISLDPHYFSSQEAAWQSRFWLGGAAADLGGGSCAQHRRSPGVGSHHPLRWPGLAARPWNRCAGASDLCGTVRCMPNPALTGHGRCLSDAWAA